MTVLRESQAFCAETMRKHAKSFYLSTRFLPRAKREAIEALYAFFRCVDDTADEGRHSSAWRNLQLDHFRCDVEGLSGRHYRGDPLWFPALAAAYRDFALDREPLVQLIDGCSRDVGGVQIATFDDLESYAAAVAGTVGRSVIPILGAADSRSLAEAEQLGIAMQYTNILRDVREDRAAGRSYLPLAQFPGEPVSGVMRRVAAEARSRYAVLPSLASRLPNDGSRAALLMAGTFYENILRGVEMRGFDPSAERVYVSGAKKIRLAAACFLNAYTGFAIIR